MYIQYIYSTWVTVGEADFNRVTLLNVMYLERLLFTFYLGSKSGQNLRHFNNLGASQYVHKCSLYSSWWIPCHLYFHPYSVCCFTVHALYCSIGRIITSTVIIRYDLFYVYYFSKSKNYDWMVTPVCIIAHVLMTNFVLHFFS